MYSLKVSGLTQAIAFVGGIKEFKKLMRVPLRSAAKEVAANEKTLLVSKTKGRAAVGVSVKSVRGGLVAKVGPRGGKYRAGYLADYFQETGTGEFGPRHKRFGPSTASANKHGGRSRSEINPWHAAAMSFAPGGGGDKIARMFVKGMRPRPWLDEAARFARTRAPAAIEAGVKEEIAKAAHA